MNLLLSLVVMSVVLFQGAQLPAFEQQAVVIGSFADKSAGEKAGLKVGDRIVTVDGKPTDTWDQFSLAIVAKAKREVGLGVVRDGKPVQIAVVPDGQGKYEIGDIGVMPVIHPEVDEVSPGQPAALAGLQKGDAILGVNNERNISYDHLIATIRASEGKPLEFQIKRGDTLKTITVTPHRRADLPDRRADSSVRNAHGRSRSARSRQAERPEELGMDDDDLPDARRTVHARDVREAADGASRDRGSIGYRGAGGLDSALQPDGDDQPEPRAAQPDADSRPRRRPHLHPRARGARASRLQHECE
jgi:membrane-associated protease RseP (regulator of RpoE activity)